MLNGYRNTHFEGERGGEGLVKKREILEERAINDNEICSWRGSFFVCFEA